MRAESNKTAQSNTPIWPGPAMHVAIGGLISAVVAAPLITNLFDAFANPNPIGYLLVLLGLPLGGLVFRIRSRRLPVDPDAKRISALAIAATILIPLCLAILVGPGSGSKAVGIIGIGFLVAMSATTAILSCGFRRSL